LLIFLYFILHNPRHKCDRGMAAETVEGVPTDVPCQNSQIISNTREIAENGSNIWLLLPIIHRKIAIIVMGISKKINHIEVANFNFFGSQSSRNFKDVKYHNIIDNTEAAKTDIIAGL